jgi:hypothetical protein
LIEPAAWALGRSRRISDDLLGDARRIRYHCIPPAPDANSYRLKEKGKAGLLRSKLAPETGPAEKSPA